MSIVVKVVPLGKYKALCVTEDGGEAKLPAALAKTFLGKELPGEYTLEYPNVREEHKEAPMTVLKIEVPKEELERFTNFTGV